VHNITTKFLTEHGFEFVLESPFDNFKRSYYAKDCILVFIDTPFGEDVHVGIGEHSFGVYRAVSLRWVKTQKDFLNLFKVVKGYELKKSKSKKPDKNCRCIKFEGGSKWHRNGCPVHENDED
jgi:hypothetical protein